MEIVKGIEIKDLALYIPKERMLVIADLHVGYEEALNKQGILVPRFHGRDMIARLDRIMQGLDIDEIVINGDLKHEFGRVSEQEWRDALRVLDFLLSKAKKVVLVRGNHDKAVGPILEKRDVEVVEEVKVGDVLILHGDVIPGSLNFQSAKVLIIGHEHPAVSINVHNRVEKFKCYLKGKYDGKTLVVMPSLKLAIEGVDVTKEELISPFLQKDISSFEVFVVGDEVLKFGRLRNLL